MRKFWTKLGITAGALLILATPGQANPGVQSEPYAGTSVGLSNLSGNKKFNSSDTMPNVHGDFPVPLFANSVGVSVFLGYSVKCNNYWLAAELSYLLDRLNSQEKMKFSQAKGIFKTRSTNAWQGLFHVGYMSHQNWVVYAIAGIDLRRFQMSFQDEATSLVIAARVNKRYMSMAFVPGVGVRMNLTKNVAIRGEYKVALYRLKSNTETVFNAASGETDTTILKQSPRVHSFQVGFIYSFCNCSLPPTM